MIEIKEEKYYIMTIVTRTEKLDTLKEVLLSLGINGMTVTNVEGCGRQNAEIVYKENGKDMVMLIPKIQVDVVFSGLDLNTVVDKICTSLRTGIMGDGKIFIKEQHGKIYKIRTGETNHQAL